MTLKRTYFPPTTAPQRKLLFETWEQTKSVTRACRIAHVGRTTFYNWLPRFKEKGYAGLEAFEPWGRHPEQVEQQKKSEPKSLKCTKRIQTGAKGGWRMNWPRPTTGYHWFR